MNLMVKRGLLAGIAAAAFGFVFMMIVNLVLPSVAREYQNTSLFRAWTDPLMTVYFAYPFILGLALSYLWDIVKDHIKGKTETEQAIRFANLYLIVATIPGMFISYTCFQISLTMVLVWAVSGYLNVFICGWVFRKVKK